MMTLMSMATTQKKKVKKQQSNANDVTIPEDKINGWLRRQ